MMRRAVGLMLVGALLSGALASTVLAKKGKAPLHKKNMAVAPFKLANVSAADAEVIADALRSELTATDTFKVVDRGRMEEILGEQRFQLLGVTNEAEAVKLGRILNVEEMVFGSMSKLGKTIYLTATVISIETAEVKASKSIEGGSVKNLRKKLPQVAEELARAYQSK